MFYAIPSSNKRIVQALWKNLKCNEIIECRIGEVGIEGLEKRLEKEVWKWGPIQGRRQCKAWQVVRREFLFPFVCGRWMKRSYGKMICLNGNALMTLPLCTGATFQLLKGLCIQQPIHLVWRGLCYKSIHRFIYLVFVLYIRACHRSKIPNADEIWLKTNNFSI